MENHHYEEPGEKGNRVFANMRKEDEMNENYESIEEKETTV